MNNLIQVRKVVNASGRMTKLGVSTPAQSVLEAMSYGASNYVVMDELLEAVNAKIASLLGAGGSCATASASSGIALTIASILAKDVIYDIENLHKVVLDKPREIVMLKGHNVNYGVPIETMINLGGGIVREVGSSNMATMDELRTTITDQTVALLFVKSHHTVQKNMLSIEEMQMVAEEFGLPLIIDAAAEEDLKKYVQMKADYVIYSGTKAIEGPTSGFVLTKSKEQARLIAEQYKGIGRAMKVGKETLYGLLQAIDNYLLAKPQMIVTDVELEAFYEKVNEIKGLHAKWEPDEAGRPIRRVAIAVDASEYGQDARSLVDNLAKGDVAIFTRDYYVNVGSFSIDPRPLLPGDLDLILTKLQNERKK